MKNIFTTILLIISLSVVAQTNNDQLVDYFTNNGLSNAVKTTQHPAGEYYEGITYVAYQGPEEDPYIASYNHIKGEWSGPFKAGESVLPGPNARPGKIDNHGKPAMIIDDEGYIHLVFGGHGGTKELGVNHLGNYHAGEMKHVVTKNPLDITEWKELENISPFGTYNQFVKMDNGDIYLFYRHGAHRSDWVYQLSTDNGRTFDPPVSLLKSKQTTGTEENPVIYDTWYAWFENGHGNDIAITYNYHVCKGPNHDGERHHCYYMVFDTDNKELKNVQGEPLDIPVTKELADEKTLVVDTDTLWTVRGTVRLDEKGYPHIIFYQGERMGLKHGGPKQVIYYRWTGKEWQTSETSDLPVAKGDMIVESLKEVRLLLAGNENGGATLRWWKSTDGGLNFEKAKKLLELEHNGINTTAFIRNAHPDARVIVSGKHKGPYKKMYLVGDRGAIKRLKSEANQINH